MILYRQNISVIIVEDTHEDCLFKYKLMKHFIEAWMPYIVMIKDTKDRHTPVLNREIQVIIQGSTLHLQCFRNGISDICMFYDVKHVTRHPEMIVTGD